MSSRNNIVGSSLRCFGFTRDINAQTIREGHDCTAIDFVGGAKCRENEAFTYKMRTWGESVTFETEGVRRYYDPRSGECSLSFAAALSARVRGEQ